VVILCAFPYIFLVDTSPILLPELRWLFYASVFPYSWSILILTLLPEVPILCILPSSWSIFHAYFQISLFLGSNVRSNPGLYRRQVKTRVWLPCFSKMADLCLFVKGENSDDIMVCLQLKCSDELFGKFV
jgi:hypothetical protein